MSYDESGSSNGGSSGGDDSSRQLVSSDVDRGDTGGEANGSGESTGEPDGGCSSTGPNGSVPLGTAGAAMAIFGLLALRRRF